MSLDTYDAQVELAALRKKAREARKVFARSKHGPFAKTMLAAMAEYDEARRNGVTRDDAARGLTEVLRSAWPWPTSKFKPVCDVCEDTGYREMRCWDQQQCGRKKCAMYPENEHNYVVPCGCETGDRMRRKVRSTEDAIAAVGRMQQKKRGFSRLGQ